MHVHEYAEDQMISNNTLTLFSISPIFFRKCDQRLEKIEKKKRKESKQSQVNEVEFYLIFWAHAHYFFITFIVY